MRFLLFVISGLFSLVMQAQGELPVDYDEKINLALRRTADKLLRLEGDATSRIPPVSKTDEYTWRIYLNRSFSYSSLPQILQESIDRQGIDLPYHVTVRECESEIIALGYHQQDLVQDSLVPCSGREINSVCHFIEIRFTPSEISGNQSRASWPLLFLITALVLLALGWFIFRRSRDRNRIPENNDGDPPGKWITFGASRFDPDALMLESGAERIGLTYREAKLLRLFALHTGELLERENILQQVWGEDGIQVGRSVDMFVSRLRKKLQYDPSVSIVAVHGMGYRMDIANVSV